PQPVIPILHAGECASSVLHRKSRFLVGRRGNLLGMTGLVTRTPLLETHDFARHFRRSEAQRSEVRLQDSGGVHRTPETGEPSLACGFKPSATCLLVTPCSTQAGCVKLARACSSLS